jgi:hypothetical protein
MKIPCPTCHRRGTVDERFGYLKYVHEGLFGREYTYPATAQTISLLDLNRVLVDQKNNRRFLKGEWPQVKCESCGGTGWIERVPDILMGVELTERKSV